MKENIFLTLLILITYNSLFAYNNELQQTLKVSIDMIENGEFSPAENNLKRLIYISTDRKILLSSYFWNGYLKYREEVYDSALCNFKNSLKFSSDVIDKSIICLWIAKSFYQINVLDSSETYFSKIDNTIPIKGFNSEFHFYKSLLKFKESKIDDALSVISLIFNRAPPKWILANLYYSYSYLYQFKYPPNVSGEFIDSLLTKDKTKKLYMFKGFFEMKDSNYTSAEKDLRESLSNKQSLFSKYSYTLLLWDLIFQNKFYEVTATYNDTLNIPDYNESILFLYGYSLEKIHSYNNAIKTFDELVSNYPQSRYAPYAMFFKGLSLINIKKYSRALTLFENFETIFPKNHNLYYFSRYYHAYTLYKLGKYDNAIDIFKTIICENPHFHENDRVYYMLAKCYQNLKQYDIAINNFNTVVDSFPNSLNYEYAKYNIAVSNYLKKRYRKALKQFSELCSGNRLPKNINEDIYFYREKCKLKIGEYGNIIEMAIAFVKQYPNMDRSKELISEIDLYYRNKGNIKNLINFYRYLVDSTTTIRDKSVYLRSLAGVYTGIRDYQMALYYYNKISPQSFEDQLTISDLLIKLKHFNEAIQLLRGMMKNYNSPNYSNRILFNISKCYNGIGKFSEAEKILNSIVRSYNDVTSDSFYINTIITLSEIYARNGKITKAESLLTKTAENKHFMQYTLYKQLADLLYSEDDYEDAIKIAKKASLYINQDTDKLSSIYYFISRCYLKLRDTDKALQKLDEAQLLTRNQLLLNKIIIMKDKIKKGKF